MTKYYYHCSLMPNLIMPERQSRVFDRSRSMFDLPDIEVLTPIGKLCNPKSIDQLFYDRAQSIIQIAGTRKIIISWSGGIDSTSVLVAFLMTAPKSQLVVLMNNDSIEEYPDFYNKYIKDQLEVIEMSSILVLEQCIKDGIVVTGETFDPTFGDESTHPAELLYFSLDKFLKPLNKYTQDCYSRSIEACPTKLTNVKEFFWWMYYCICYQWGETHWLLYNDNLIIEKNIFHFPSNQDWNDYAVSTPTEVRFPGNDYRNFKIELKNYIYRFTKDEYYRKNKIKYPSLNNNIMHRHDECLYIKTDWTRGHNL